jgi:hypothetical protein
VPGCLKEIRNYPLYIRFRYSWLPQGDQELSAVHPVQVFMTASRRSGTIRYTSGSGIHGCLKEIKNYPFHCTSGSGVHCGLKEIRIYPLNIRFRYSWLPQGDQELSALQYTSGSGIYGCLKEIRNNPFYIRLRYSWLPQGDQELSLPLYIRLGYSWLP